MRDLGPRSPMVPLRDRRQGSAVAVVRRLCETTSKPSYIAGVRKIDFDLDVLWQFIEESNARHSNQAHQEST